MLKLAQMYDWNTIADRSKSPTRTIKAIVSFDEKDLAKSAGFFWNPQSKSWLLEIKECDLENSAFDFQIDILN